MLRALVSLRTLLLGGATAAVVCFSQVAGASALGDLAASMQPGSFAQLTPMTGWNSGSVLSPLSMAGCTSGDYVTSYADKAAWDPTQRRVLFLGQAHGQCYGGEFVIYDDATNAWSVGPWPSGICQNGTSTNPCFDHAYDNNTVNPATGVFYYRDYGSPTVLQYQNGAWSALPKIPAQDMQCCSALEFFPPLNELIFIDGDWGVWAYSLSKGSWTQLANSDVANGTPGLPNLPMAPTSVFAEYNPVQQTLLFGGSTHLYKMNASGQITTLNPAPMTLGPANTVVSVDPVGGKYLVLSGSSMYQYDVTTDTWTQLAIAVPPALMGLGGVGDGLVAADLPTYGVVMYIKYNNASSVVYLYKHSPTPAAAVKPLPPTAVQAK